MVEVVKHFAFGHFHNQYNGAFTMMGGNFGASRNDTSSEEMQLLVLVRVKNPQLSPWIRALKALVVVAFSKQPLFDFVGEMCVQL